MCRRYVVTCCYYLNAPSKGYCISSWLIITSMLPIILSGRFLDSENTEILLLLKLGWLLGIWLPEQVVLFSLLMLPAFSWYCVSAFYSFAYRIIWKSLATAFVVPSIQLRAIINCAKTPQSAPSRSEEESAGIRMRASVQMQAKHENGIKSCWQLAHMSPPSPLHSNKWKRE